MSLDDIQFLKSHSFKQHYTFIIDSKDRDYIDNPYPNNYTIYFTEPFKNVFGLEVIDASVPRTMYNVDQNNNTLVYYIGNIEDNIETLNYITIELDIGDFSLPQLIQLLNKKLINLKIESLSTPPDVKNKIAFTSPYPFVLDMNKSTLRDTLGFNLTQNVDSGFFTKITDPNIIKDKNKFRYFMSKQSNSTHRIEAPGIVDLIGEKYVILNCPEIEEHSTLSLSYSKHNLGLARFKLGTLGYNDENISIQKTSIREFHPIGKFSRMTLTFKTQSGKLYDFKGANHNITFKIYYYQALTNIPFDKSILNPNYNPDVLEYRMNQIDKQDSEDSSDESSES
tara:strand:- start:757 stop:1770 length:1014 start_codon:yes stop_codon:yes gene_type:complete